VHGQAIDVLEDVLSESLQVWMEIVFNVAYLVVVWGLVGAMVLRRATVAPADESVARLVRWAFALLALGDTGHVGFRVLAYATGGLDTQFSLFGRQIGLVGLGALCTAVTVTLFYVLLLETWRVRFGSRYGWFEYVLLAAGAVRLLLLIPAANQWNSVVPPQPYVLYRNLPLVLLGLGTAFLILRDARRAGDRAFSWIGIMIFVSYACYLPVILFVQQLPIIGMLMIPKTMAYLVVGFVAYFELYRTRRVGQHTSDAVT
jgi:hypothetical protein